MNAFREKIKKIVGAILKKKIWISPSPEGRFLQKCPHI